jgi:amino acid adenylation domain-containing protein
MSHSQQPLSERRARLSPEQLAALQSRLHGKAAAAPATIARGAHGDQAAMSFAQQRMWFLWRLQPHSAAYHLQGGLLLRGRLDAEALRAGMQAIVQRHACLRTVFVETAPGQAEQCVLPPSRFELPLQDLSALAPAERELRMAEAVQQALRTPFDLAAGPLLRCLLLRCAEDEHRLVIVMHHIVSDGQSTRIILDELAMEYGARAQGRVPALPAPSIRYSDYAAWQRDWVRQPHCAQQLDWWRDQIGEAPAEPLLRADRTRGADGVLTAARQSVPLDPELVARLRLCAQSRGATLFMALLAGCQALLYRLSGQEQPRVGVPVANRHITETAAVVGCFVNTQVMVARIAPRMTLAGLLDQVRDMATAAQSRQDLPFDHLVEKLQPAREPGTPPFFQVMFNHLRLGRVEGMDWPGLRVDALDFEEPAAQFDLAIQSTEDDAGRVQLGLLYARELFDASTMERMARHFAALLHALAWAPDQALDDVPLPDGTGLAPQPQRRVLAPGLALHQRIAQQAALRPQATALVLDGQSLGYGELDLRANRLAHRLIGLGVGPEDKVGLAMERSLDMVVAMLAILKAGAAYVPLDPQYPAERLAYMVADSGMRLLIALGEAAQGLELPAGLDLLRLQAGDLDQGAAHDPGVATHADGLAYVIYTSGSTGRPKGVQISHRNVGRLLDGTHAWFGFGPDDVWTLFHSFAFDFSVWEIFGALCSGGRLVIVPYWISRSPPDFLQLLRDQGVTVLSQTPSAFGQLMHVPGLYDAPLALRTVVFGGEALDPQRLQAWVARWGDRQPRLVNMYGITETTVHVTYRPLAARDVQAQRSPLGVAIPDLALKVLDASLNPVPLGAAGELYVAGEGLARSYLGQPGLSAQRFVADPFDSGGGRLYRTGDLARRHADGELEYLGRVDHQVKIRGFRIELGEVQAQLQSLPGVREAAVLVQQGAGGPRLVAYASALAGHRLEAVALREQLEQRLPGHMVPGAVTVLDGLPLNANGKLDTRALPAPAPGSDKAYEAPRGEAEQALAALWAEVLGVERVGRNDNFFELGGHSLMAVQLSALLLGRHGCEVPVRSFFEAPVLKALAACLPAQGLGGLQARQGRLSRMSDLMDEFEV